MAELSVTSWVGVFSGQEGVSGPGHRAGSEEPMAQGWFPRQGCPESRWRRQQEAGAGLRVSLALVPGAESDNGGTQSDVGWELNQKYRMRQRGCEQQTNDSPRCQGQSQDPDPACA